MLISEPHSKQFSGQLNLDQIRRILILRMGPLGETLLTTPVIRALRRRFPEGYIAYMVAPGREDLVSENPNLDEVITYSVSIPKLIYNMAKRSFQMAVVLQPTFRLVLHTFLARIPFRIGFETNSGKGRLLHVAVPNNIDQHETARYLDVIRGIGIEPDSEEPEMFVNPKAQGWADDFLAGAGIPPDRPLVGLNPGSGSESRRWSKSGFAQVGDRLHQKYDAQIFITAGDAEGALPHDVADLMSCSPIILTGITPMQLGATAQKMSSLYQQRYGTNAHEHGGQNSDDCVIRRIKSAPVGTTLATSYDNRPRKYGGYHRRRCVRSSESVVIPSQSKGAIKTGDSETMEFKRFNALCPKFYVLRFTLSRSLGYSLLCPLSSPQRFRLRRRVHSTLERGLWVWAMRLRRLLTTLRQDFGTPLD